MVFFDYLRDVRGELRHVSWPTKNQTIAFTVTVVAISVIVGLFLGLLDYSFAQALQRIINK